MVNVAKHGFDLVYACAKKIPQTISGSTTDSLKQASQLQFRRNCPYTAEYLGDFLDLGNSSIKNLENLKLSNLKANEVIKALIKKSPESQKEMLSQIAFAKNQQEISTIINTASKTKYSLTPKLFERLKNINVTITQANALRAKGFVANYTNDASANVLRQNLNLSKELNLKFQIQKSFVQPNVLDDYPEITKEALEASNNFAKTSKTGFAPMPDGFRYTGGSSSSFNNKGLPNPAFKAHQEAILVDFKNDKTLNKVINTFEQKIQNTDLTQEQKLEAMMQYVGDIFGKPEQAEKLVNNFEKHKLYNLGEIIDSGAGACRHRSLLTKALGDRIGIKVSCVEGNYKTGGHMWCDVQLENGKKLLADPMHNAIINVSNPQKMYSKALHYRVEANKATGQLKQLYI